MEDMDNLNFLAVDINVHSCSLNVVITQRNTNRYSFAIKLFTITLIISIVLMT